MPPAAKSPRLAVLIDAENASARIAEALFTEIATLGEASSRRIYGDFASAQLAGWTRVLARFAIQPQQNFANTKGKNSGDIALVIDGMDLLHSGRFDGFLPGLVRRRLHPAGVADPRGGGRCLRLRRAQDPRKLPAGLHPVHLYREPQRPGAGGGGAPPPPGPASRRPSPRAGRKPSEASRLIASVIADMDEDGDGWVSVGGLGDRLRNAYPDFDQRSYGHAKLSDLIRATGRFDVQTSSGGRHADSRQGVRIRSGSPSAPPRPRAGRRRRR